MYIYLNYEKMNSAISAIRSYGELSISGVSTVKNSNEVNKGAADLSDLNIIPQRIDEVDKLADEIQERIDVAKAQNENGITSGRTEGELAYYLPDGVDDTTHNVSSASEGALTALKMKKALSTAQTQGGIQSTQEILNQLKEFQDDPAFSASFVDQYGTENLIKAPIDVQSMFSAGSYKDNIRYKDASDIFGHILAAASHTWKPGNGLEKARVVSSAINQHGKYGLATGLNSMLSNDGLEFDDLFLLNLGRELERIPWNPHWDKNWTHLSSTIGERIEDEATDPLKGVLNAMGNSPRAATEFLSPHIDTDKNASRVRDLLNRHSFEDQGWINSWSKLSSSTSNFSREVLPDGHEPSPNASRAAIINSVVINSIGESGAEVSEKARSFFSEALKNYAWSIDRTANSQDDPGPNELIMTPDQTQEWTQGLTAQPLLTTKGLSGVLGEISKDSEHLKSISSEVALLEQARMGWAASVQNSDEPLEGPSLAAIKSNSATAGFLLGASRLKKEGEAAATDKRNQMIIDTLFAGSVFLRGPGNEASQLWKDSYSYAQGRIQEGAHNAVSNGFTGNLAREMQESVAQRKQYNRSSLISSLTQMITWNPKYAEHANAVVPDLVQNNSADPKQLIVDPNKLTKENLDKIYDHFYLQPADEVEGDLYQALDNAQDIFDNAYNKARNE